MSTESYLLGYLQATDDTCAGKSRPAGLGDWTGDYAAGYRAGFVDGRDWEMAGVMVDVEDCREEA